MDRRGSVSKKRHMLQDVKVSFHSYLLDLFDSEVIVKADFVCSVLVKIMCRFDS